jgi:SPP1 gp7 family putative phage head morphogenesis protein
VSLSQTTHDLLHARRIRHAFTGRRPALRRAPIARQKYPNAIELSYLRFILAVLRPLHAATIARIEPVVRREVEARAQKTKTDAVDDVPEAIGLIRETVDSPSLNSELRRQTRSVGENVSRHQGRQLQEQIRKAVGVELPLKDPGLGERLAGFVAENVSLIKTVETQYLDRVQSTLVSGITAGRTWNEMAGELQKAGDVSESRAALIARDQVGKLYGAVNQARQETLGVQHYIWKTSNDERVREEHAALDGERFSWDEGAGEEGNPGEAINCRCIGEPDFEELLSSLEGDGE